MKFSGSGKKGDNFMKKFDVVAFGEILIDFTFAGKNSDGKNLFEENTGGAPGNCVGAVCKLGGSGAFIGMTGEDSFGRNIRRDLEKINVDVGGMKTCCSQHTTLAFVSLNEKGERSFSFCRNPGADTQISFDDVDRSYLDQARILHVGSLSLTQEPAKSTTIRMIEYVRKSGGLVSYDPNWRANLWPDREKALDELRSIFPYADIVKVSDEELRLLFGDVSCEEGAEKITALGAKLVSVTLGSEGVYYRYENGGTVFDGRVGSPKVDAVDTTGAGDSFGGGLLYRLTRKENPLDFTHEELRESMEFACAVAARCVTKRGGLPALPVLSEVEKLIEGN